ncbi:MAG: hypothetical protein AAF493_09270 [Pseudomonadota bacterium]
MDTTMCLGKKTLLSASLAAALALHVSPASAAKFKCWTNDEGVRECGNVVPPKYAQKRYDEVNKQGVTVRRIDRAKTKDEIAAEEKEAAELAAREKEQARKDKIRAAKDRVLLDTFTTEEDLILAHQGRMAAIDSRVQHTQQIVNGLNSELTSLHKEAATKERAGQPIPDTLATRIKRTQTQIDDNRGFIEDRHQEKIELTEQFERDRARYRELKLRQARN